MHRDQVRRLFSQIPPIDDGVGVAGAQPTRNPYPTNANINHALDMAVAWASRKGQLGGDWKPRQIPIAAQTDVGPFALFLQHIGPTLAANEVKRVAWIPSGTTQETLLIPDNRENLDRQRYPVMTQTPGTPQRFWTEAGRLMIWPAPADAGTLSLMVGLALWSQDQDLDGQIIEIIPDDYLEMVDWKTVSILCGEQPDDMVLRDLKLQAEAQIADILPDFLSYCARSSRSYQGRLVAGLGANRGSRTGVMQGRR